MIKRVPEMLIGSCAKCPHNYSTIGTGYFDTRVVECTFTGRTIFKEDLESDFPKWCPLETFNQETFLSQGEINGKAIEHHYQLERKAGGKRID